jgi:Flp pilus assembly CpaF family ATPase
LAFDLGWELKKEKTPYYVQPLDLRDGERKILKLLLDALMDEPSKDLKALLVKICEEKNILLEKSSGEKIMETAGRFVKGFGVLDFLLDDDSLEEISVVGVGKPIFVFHRKNGWMETNAFFTNEEQAIDTINKMARPLGRRVTFQNPRLNAVLPDGSRLHASISPVSLNGVEMTIRKFKRNPFHALELAQNETISTEALAFLWTVIYGDVSLCIAGNTGSGKTTTLNALFSFIPLNERIVVTEETPELYFLHKHLVKIIANDELGVGMRELVKDTLRMRPDRVVIGEVRGREEVEALFDSLLAGQAKGSFFTFHADSAGEALLRLKALGVSEEDLNAVDLIVVQKRISFFDRKNKRATELRRVTEIAEVNGGKHKVLFSLPDPSKPLEKTKNLESSVVVEKTLRNYGFSNKEFFGEVEKRKKFLEKMQAKDFEDFTRQVQAFSFESG